MSLSRDNTHSWVRISHGSNKFVMDSNNNDTEVPEDQLEEHALQLSAKDFACRSKPKAKPQRREPAGSSPRIVPIERRNWIDIEPGKYSLFDYEISKKVIHLLRHSQQMHREEDGAVHFWRMKENLQNPFPQSVHWSDGRWKACLAGGGGEKRRYQYCTDVSGIIVHLRAIQGHSGRNLIDPSLQDNVIIQSNFVHHIYHVGCAFNLHSIINSGLIPGGQSSSKRQTVFFLPVDPVDKSHKDPDVIDLSVPRHAQYLHNAWKRHQDAIYWVDINLAIKNGLTFYQTRSNAIILQETLPPYCIPKVVRMETGEVLYEKVYMSPRPPPKISLRHEWKRELGSEHAQHSEIGQLSRSFQSNQPILNPIRERTGRPVITHDVINVPDNPQTRSAHESETFNVEDKILRKRMEKSVADHDENHESMMVNEADMDFRIPGLPHSVVKHAQSTSVRGLIQKIENHPDRHAHQQDLRQKQSLNDFSPESKQMIQDVGNIELCELLETEPKTQCKACLSYWNVGRHRLLHMRAFLAQRNSGPSKNR